MTVDQALAQLLQLRNEGLGEAELYVDTDMSVGVAQVTSFDMEASDRVVIR